ncbi:hypothetical protein R6Q57_027603 [Mikania cordata]
MGSGMGEVCRLTKKGAYSVQDMETGKQAPLYNVTYLNLKAWMLSFDCCIIYYLRIWLVILDSFTAGGGHCSQELRKGNLLAMVPTERSCFPGFNRWFQLVPMGLDLDVDELISIAWLHRAWFCSE